MANSRSFEALFNNPYLKVFFKCYDKETNVFSYDINKIYSTAIDPTAFLLFLFKNHQNLPLIGAMCFSHLSFHESLMETLIKIIQLNARELTAITLQECIVNKNDLCLLNHALNKNKHIISFEITNALQAPQSLKNKPHRERNSPAKSLSQSVNAFFSSHRVAEEHIVLLGENKRFSCSHALDY